MRLLAASQRVASTPAVVVPAEAGVPGASTPDPEVLGPPLRGEDGSGVFVS
ncbi:MAG: hypothetical protein AB7E83_24385 [Ramlibacter sp.]